MELQKPKRILIVGLGGIGSRLARDIAQHLASTKDVDLQKTELVLIDGDRYEARNSVRQNVGELTNKAEATQHAIQEMYPTLRMKSVKAYLGEKSGLKNTHLVVSAKDTIKDGDWVFGCVDNHRTRLLISQTVQALKNAVYIDGGNEEFDGSVIVHIRQAGIDITPPIEKNQPTIATPRDKAPHELSCEEAAAQGATQYLVANATAALLMMITMWRLLEESVETTDIASVGYFDLNGALKKGAVVVFQKPPN